MGKQKKLLAGVGEKAQYLVHELNDNTIRFVLEYPGLPEPRCMSAAVKALVDGIEILHSSFHTNAFRAYWTVNEDYGERDYFAHIKTGERPMEVAHRLCLESVAPEGKSQLRCYLVQDEKSSALVFLLSHLCADGGDAKYLLLRLTEAYELIRSTGSAEGLKLKNGSRRAEQAYAGVGLKNYLSLMKNPISKVKTAFPYESTAPGTPRLVRVELPPETMQWAKERAKTHNATANDLLLTACYHSFAALSGDRTKPVSILSMMDLRRHCEGGDSQGLSNLSGAMTTVLPEGLCETFEETLRLVAEQTAAAKADPLAGLEGMPLLHNVIKCLPMGLLLLVAGKLYGSFSIGLTNLGKFPGEALKLGGLCPHAVTFGGPLKRKPGMQISAAFLEDRCALSVMGFYTEADGELLQKLLDQMAFELSAYAAETEN